MYTDESMFRQSLSIPYDEPAHSQEHLCSNKLIIAGANAIPYEITVGGHIKRHDTHNSHEEADVIIVNQVLSSARQGYKTIPLCMAIHDVFVIIMGTLNFLQNPGSPTMITLNVHVCS